MMCGKSFMWPAKTPQHRNCRPDSPIDGKRYIAAGASDPMEPPRAGIKAMLCRTGGVQMRFGLPRL